MVLTVSCPICRTPTTKKTCSRSCSAKLFRVNLKNDPDRHSRFVEKVKHNQARIWKERVGTEEGLDIRKRIAQTRHTSESLLSKDELKVKYAGTLSLEQRQEHARNSLGRWYHESSMDVLQELYHRRYKSISLSLANKGATMSHGKMTYKGFFTPRNPEKYVGDIKTIVFRSLWERKTMQWIDESPATIHWSSEELKIPYFDPVRQRIRIYYPDFLTKVQTKTGIKTFILEIKPYHETVLRQTKRKSEKLLQEAAIIATNQAKFRAATIFAEEQGWEFKVLTEKDLNF